MSETEAAERGHVRRARKKSGGADERTCVQEKGVEKIYKQITGEETRQSGAQIRSCSTEKNGGVLFLSGVWSRGGAVRAPAPAPGS